MAQQRSPDIQLTFSDVYVPVLATAQATLEANQLRGRVVVSEGFSNLQGPFEVIITNPPFHEGRYLSTQATATWIREATHYLVPSGQLFLVANTFLPYAAWLDHTFGHPLVIAHNRYFKCYQVRKP